MGNDRDDSDLGALSIEAWWVNQPKAQMQVDPDRWETLLRRLRGLPNSEHLRAPLIGEAVLSSWLDPATAVDWRETERDADVGDWLMLRGSWTYRRSPRGGREGVECYLKERQAKGSRVRARAWVALEHAATSTGRSDMSGKKQSVILGRVESVEPPVELRPIVIGTLVRGFGNSNLSIGLSHDEHEVYPSQVDAFEGVDFQRRATQGAARAVAHMYEARLKELLASAIGEPFVPKDHGGERSDLFTSRMSIEGESTSAAFVLKAKAAPRTVHLRHLGKNGDQLVRATSEPVRLIVLGHTGNFDSLVRRRLEETAFYRTFKERHPTRWLTLDGETLARIFEQLDLLSDEDLVSP